MSKNKFLNSNSGFGSASGVKIKSAGQVNPIAGCNPDTTDDCFFPKPFLSIL